MLTIKGLLSWLEGLDMFRLGAVATGGKKNPSGNLSFKKTTFVGCMSGSSSQRDGIAFAEGFCDLGGGIMLAKGLHD
jgi:hypothetical protein